MNSTLIQSRLTWIVLLVATLGVLFISGIVNADVYVSQTSDKSVAQDVSTDQRGQIFLATSNSTIYSGKMNAASTFAGQTLTIQIYKCGGVSSATTCASNGGSWVASTSPQALTSTPTDYSFTFSSGVPVVSGTYYAIVPVRCTFG